MRRFRKLGVGRAAEFLKKFPLKSFLLQAPQVTADIWGVGIQLGTVMGFVADATWAGIRSLSGRGATFRGPPPSDPLGKAANYLAQPSYQYTGGDWLSYDDHWLLLAADVVALGILMQEYSPRILDERAETIINSPIVYQEPWKESTRAALRAEGWRGDEVYIPPFAGMDESATYGDVLIESENRFPAFLAAIQNDFPRGVSPAIFANVFSDLVMGLHGWASGGQFTAQPIFEPEELTMGRMFEYGIFPPAHVTDELMLMFTERSLELAAAAGRDLPGPIEMQASANETWGGFVTS